MEFDLLHAATDAVLAGACLGGAGWLSVRAHPAARQGALGLALVGLGAVSGTAAYLTPAADGVHDALSWAARSLGVPWFGTAFLVVLARDAVRGRVAVVLLVAVGALALLFGADPEHGTRISSLANFAIIGVCLARARAAPRWAAAGVAGAVLTAVAALGIGSEGELAGIARVDLFHLGLAASHGLEAWALGGLASDAGQAALRPSASRLSS